MSDQGDDFVFVSGSDVRNFAGDSAILPQTSQTRARIQKWLAPSEYAAEASDYNKHLRSYCPQTGHWLRQSSPFVTWNQNATSALWINGIPGSGKSVVAASLSKQFKEEKHVPVLYFFFRHANLANRTPKQMTRDWLAQLLDHSPFLQIRLKDLMEKTSSHDAVTFEELWQCLCSAAAAASKVYCVADALDEMEAGNDWFLPKLVDLGLQAPTTLKVLITSRQSPHIEKVFKSPLVSSINLDRSVIDQDIATYIDYLLSNCRVPDLPADQHQMIKTIVQQRANGLFIYAKLMMDEIMQSLASTNVKILLEDLPIGMDAMYTALLQEHSRRSGVSPVLQRLILEWITHASRPLRLLEVAELIRSLPLSQTLGKIQETKETVRSACGPLLTVLPDETLQVIHHSFTEFLVNAARVTQEGTDYTVFQSREIHTAAAIACIDYVVACSTLQPPTSDEIDKRAYRSDSDHSQQDALFLKHPFLQYAVKHWMAHAIESDGDDPLLIQALDRLLTVPEHHFTYWQRLWRRYGRREHRDCTLQVPHMLSLFGLDHYLSELCLRGLDVNTKDSKGHSPLSYACEAGHLKVVGLLLFKGASCSIISRLGIAPIHYACASNRPTVVQYLLQSGADPLLETPEPDIFRVDKRDISEIRENRRRFGKNALIHACEEGYNECLRLMLDSLPTETYQIGPLHWAAKAGKHDTVEFLLKTYHLNPNHHDTKGNTPLCLAASRRCPTTIRKLLKVGARTNKVSTGADRYYGLSNHVRKKEDTNETLPLHAWACGLWDSNTQNLIKTGEILIDAGCDVNAPDTEGKTPIFWWAKNRDPSVVLKFLVDHGADASIEDQFGNTALYSWTSRSSNEDLTAILSHGGNLNKARHIDGKTPLMCLVGTWGEPSHLIAWTEWVEKYGVNPNAQDCQGKTVLHHLLAQNRWDPTSVRNWLAAGADPSIRDRKGRNCLFGLYTDHSQKMKEDEGHLMKTLVAAGLDLHSTDHRGYNIVLNAVDEGKLEYVERLEDYGADFQIKCHEGRAALHVLASRLVKESSSWRPIACLKYLLDQGLDPNDRDYAGDTMLHVLVSSAKLADESFRLFLRAALDAGADPGIQNHQGRTILHIAVGLPVEVVRRYNQSDTMQVLESLLPLCVNTGHDLADFNGVTPLHLAATTCAIRVFVLLSAGFSITTSDHQSRSVLHYAARSGNSNALGLLCRTLVEQEQLTLINQADCNGRTALHDAARSGVPESVFILLEALADPNIRDHHGRSPLHAASENNEERMMMTLQSSTQRQYTSKGLDFGRNFKMPAYESHPGGLRVNDPLRPKTAIDNSREESIVDVKSPSRLGDVARMLLKAGTDPFVSDNDRLNALNYCLIQDCKDVASVLQSEMANLGLTITHNNQEDRVARLKLSHWNREEAAPVHSPRHLITSREDANSFLTSAVLEGKEFTVKAMLGLGADPLYEDDDKRTALHSATSLGLLEIMRLLLDGVSKGQKLPPNLLHEAARRPQPNIDMIQLLIMSGCEVNALEVDLSKNVRYHWVAENNRSVAHVLAVGAHWWQSLALDYLLKTGLDPESRTSTGRTALHIAVRGRIKDNDSHGFWRTDTSKVLLSHGAKIDVVDDEERTPLIEAVEGGVDLVDLLIAHGANVNYGPSSPIGHAVSPCDLQVMKALLEAGADCNVMCKADHRAKWSQEPVLLHISDPGNRGYGRIRRKSDDSCKQVEQAIELLLGAGANANFTLDDGTPLLTAAIEKYGVVTPSMSSHKYIEARDSRGMTPFLAACVAGHKDDRLEMLIQAGADPRAVDLRGRNAIHWAVINASIYYGDDFERADFFMAKGVDIDLLDNERMTPLHYAVQKGNHMSPPVIRRLLNGGADASIPYPDRETSILHLILPCMAEGGQSYMAPPSMIEPLVQQFIDAGANKEARDSNGNTPIFAYVTRPTICDSEYEDENRYPDLDEQRRVLQDYNIYAKNNAGETLLHVVAKRSHDLDRMRYTKDMFKLLLDLGLDPKREDKAQRTPLDVAAACGNTLILDLFAPKKMS
ncbi:MAG: hypothetical protein Q9220_005499 [cf. Caloplaca sp. 1 TL-2023]